MIFLAVYLSRMLSVSESVWKYFFHFGVWKVEEGYCQLCRHLVEPNHKPSGPGLFFIGLFLIIGSVVTCVRLLRFSISYWVSVGNVHVSRYVPISSRLNSCLVRASPQGSPRTLRISPGSVFKFPRSLLILVICVFFFSLLVLLKVCQFTRSFRWLSPLFFQPLFCRLLYSTCLYYYLPSAGFGSSLFFF